MDMEIGQVVTAKRITVVFRSAKAHLRASYKAEKNRDLLFLFLGGVEEASPNLQRLCDDALGLIGLRKMTQTEYDAFVEQYERRKEDEKNSPAENIE